MFRFSIVWLALLLNFSLAAQEQSTVPELINWQLGSPVQDNLMGVSSERTLKELAAGRTSKTVVVAVIDSGVDIEHEDLQGQIWINEDEIAGNGIDDDNNGYVDDVHGWNFLGNSNGDILEFENMELTRLYRKYDKMFGSKKEADITEPEKAEWEEFQRVKEAYNTEFLETKEQADQMKEVWANYQIGDRLMKKALGKDEYTVEDLNGYNPPNEMFKQIRDMMVFLRENDFNEEEYRDIEEHYHDAFAYHLNPEYDGRAIIGDDPNDINDRGYGNPNVRGKAAEHGTHVAGIIAAARNNDMGMDGVAPDVKIMALRAVPNGDEYDKDIALAIEYAVENGARVINMSFGKTWSPNTKFVEDAIRKAEAKGVLLVHAAGNDATNNDEITHYPTRHYTDGAVASNYLIVGASAHELGLELLANFSNYGKENVDLFSPGVDIYSLEPDNVYKENSGTSMAAPVASGVAALILAYFPDLTAAELREILLESVTDLGKVKVNLPDTEAAPGSKRKKTKLKKLCATGGIINAYQAFELAAERAGSGATSQK